MTPEEQASIRRTAAVMEQCRDEFGRHFYCRLFELHPSARELLPEDLQAQGGRLVDEIVFMAAVTGDMPAFVERARDLGRRHRSYGVVADDYPHVGEAMRDAIANILGDAWTLMDAEAWRRFYLLIADTMLEGAACELFTPPGPAPATDPTG